MPSDKLAQIAPMIRGLLAEPSGDEDRPHRRVILHSLRGPDATDFASSADKAGSIPWPAPLEKGDLPPLQVAPPPAERTREDLVAAVGEYQSAHGRKPKVVCLPGAGVLYAAEAPTDAALPLHNQVALVTGAAGAIGLGICRGLLNAGACVAAGDLPGERLERFVGSFGAAAGQSIVAVPMDVTDEAAVAAAFETVAARWGGVDIVVVNAGIALVSRLMELDLEAFRRVERVNVEGALLTLAAAGRHLKAQGTGGDIVIISTKNVPCPGAGFGAYSSTKAACHQLGRIASLEMAEFGVRVNMVAPDAVFGAGPFKSGLWATVGPDRMRARGLDEAGLEEYYRSRNLLKARVTAEHVANAVLFFVTRQTPTTGATIPVDGGLPDATPR